MVYAGLPRACPDPNVKVPHRWQKIKPPRRRERHADSWPMARSGHSLEVVDSLVIFFGGRYRNGRFNDVYVLNTGVLSACCAARPSRA